jgi:hypothetical protein
MLCLTHFVRQVAGSLKRRVQLARLVRQLEHTLHVAVRTVALALQHVIQDLHGRLERGCGEAELELGA